MRKEVTSLVEYFKEIKAEYKAFQHKDKQDKIDFIVHLKLKDQKKTEAVEVKEEVKEEE